MLSHGQINYKDTNTKCRYLKKLTCNGSLLQALEFIGWRYSWYFRPSFVNCCPSNPSLWFTSPLSPLQSTVYTDSVWLGGGGGCPVLLKKTLYIWPDSEPTKLLDHPKQKPRRGGGLRQINTSRKVPLQVSFFR